MHWTHLISRIDEQQSPTRRDKISTLISEEHFDDTRVAQIQRILRDVKGESQPVVCHSEHGDGLLENRKVANSMNGENSRDQQVMMFAKWTVHQLIVLEGQKRKKRDVITALNSQLRSQTVDFSCDICLVWSRT